MKKQKTLDWLVRNLESWPKRRLLAPSVCGYRWCGYRDGLYLFDDFGIGGIESLTIYKCEWEQRVQDNKKEWNQKIDLSFNEAVKPAVKAYEDFNKQTKKDLTSLVNTKTVDASLNKQKAYIAGPMTGYDNFNREGFNDAANYLSMKGYIVLSPAILPDGLTQAEYMQIDLTMLQCCDAIFMLTGWKDSTGAKAEHALAVKLNMTILNQGN